MDEIKAGDNVVGILESTHATYVVLAVDAEHAWLKYFEAPHGTPFTVKRDQLRRPAPPVFEVGKMYREPAWSCRYTVRYVLPNGSAVATFDHDLAAVVLTGRENYEEA